jgi:hypothetical protein
MPMAKARLKLAGVWLWSCPALMGCQFLGSFSAAFGGSNSSAPSASWPCTAFQEDAQVSGTRRSPGGISSASGAGGNELRNGEFIIAGEGSAAFLGPFACGR